MSSSYSERDTEQVRRAEESSAGRQTQPLGKLPSGTSQVTSGEGRRNNPAALLLIGLGGLLLAGRFMPGPLNIEAGMILLTIGSCLLFFSLWQRIYGLLIPGCILAGLSIGVTFADITDGVSVLWGLSLGFLAVLLAGRALFGVKSNWPVFPAVPLFGVGVIVAVANMPSFLAGGLIWLPLLLVGLGLYLGWGRTAH